MTIRTYPGTGVLKIILKTGGETVNYDLTSYTRNSTSDSNIMAQVSLREWLHPLLNAGVLFFFLIITHCNYPKIKKNYNLHY